MEQSKFLEELEKLLDIEKDKAISLRERIEGVDILSTRQDFISELASTEATIQMLEKLKLNYQKKP